MGLWECPLQVGDDDHLEVSSPGNPNYTIVGQERNLLLPKPPEFLRFNYLACSLLGKKKNLAHKVTSGLCLKQSQE